MLPWLFEVDSINEPSLHEVLQDYYLVLLIGLIVQASFLLLHLVGNFYNEELGYIEAATKKKRVSR